MAGFYSATARFISWLAKLEHKDHWLPDGQDLQDPTTWTNSRLIALKQVHQELITQHGFREWAPPPPEAGDAGNPAAAPAYNVANAGNPAAALGPVRRPLRPPQRPMRKERSMCKTANQATLTTHPPAPSFPVYASLQICRSHEKNLPGSPIRGKGDFMQFLDEAGWRGSP